MRRLAATVVAALACVAASAGPATAAAPPPTAFVLAGGGWGHGVGMSQWGAFGQAKAGRDYRTILAHYYPGTTLGPPPVTETWEDASGVKESSSRSAVSISATLPEPKAAT